MRQEIPDTTDPAQSLVSAEPRKTFETLRGVSFFLEVSPGKQKSPRKRGLFLVRVTSVVVNDADIKLPGDIGIVVWQGDFKETGT